MATVKKIFAANLRRSLAQKGLSIGDAAMICRLEYIVMYKYVRGTVWPGDKALDKVCKGLKLEPSQLFKTSGIKKTRSKKPKALKQQTIEEDVAGDIVPAS